MKLWRFGGLLVALTTSAALLAACGDDDGGSDAPGGGGTGGIAGSGGSGGGSGGSGTGGDGLGGGGLGGLGGGTGSDCVVLAPGVGVVINEVTSDGDKDDFIELYNTSDRCVSLEGARFEDDNENAWEFTAGSVIEPGAYLVTDSNVHGIGLGGDDAVTLFVGDTVIDSADWEADEAETSFGRSPNATGEFMELTEPTPGAVNAGPPV